MLVSYDFPPVTSPGSIRLSKLTKFLPDYGWRPIVLTGTGAYSPYKPTTQPSRPMTHIERVADFDPLKKLAAAHKVAQLGASRGPSRLAWLRKIYGSIIPDRDWLWLRPAVRAGRRILQERNIRALYSTSPYITNHLIALRLKPLASLPWVAEFRDSWAYNEVWPPPILRRARMRRVEDDICTTSDHFVSVSEDYLADFRRYHDLPPLRSTVIYSGFDPDDFSFLTTSPLESFSRFSIAHAGYLYGGARSPKPLLDALKSLSQSNRIDLGRVSLEFYGPFEKEVDVMVRKSGLQKCCVWHGTFNYQELLPRLTQAYCLLLITHSGIPTFPSKLFDYMGTRRPIIAIAQSDSEVAEIVSSTGSGFSVGFEQPREFANIISRLWNQWVSGDPSWMNHSAGQLQRFQSGEQARRLAAVFDRVARLSSI